MKRALLTALAGGALLGGCAQGPPAQEPPPPSAVTVTPEQAMNATGQSQTVVPKSREEASVFETPANPDIEADQAAGNAANAVPR